MSAFKAYQPDSMMWRINRERITLLAGPAAAVLQAAHPQVAMGVAAHSRFRTDSMGRLRRTLAAVYTIAFGSEQDVARVRDAIARVHAPVKGAGPQAYSAFDPGAQLWVLATLIMASTTMYQRFIAPLSEDELDQFLMENQQFGEVFGLDPSLLPTNWNAFERYYQSMLESSLLGSLPICAEVAQAAVAPRTPWHMRIFTPVFRALAFEYIPPHLRERVGFTREYEKAWLWKVLDQTLPILIRIAPRSLHCAGQYLRAVRSL
jgi:uncharacterized protein (DUF2236 family)